MAQDSTNSESDKVHEIESSDENNVWKRGFFMIVFAIFFGVAQSILFIVAIIQFFSLLFTKKPNQGVTQFGSDLAAWLNQVALFQSAVSEDMPFPWGPWGEEDAKSSK